ncbi:MAG TPA: serine-type D-Ala-D-Ala carboxypeptidase, partial [Methylophaga sp.]|nr:serine-type D-Ala-D-Ala carboxypeptidase [Methylophaga sp.]
MIKIFKMSLAGLLFSVATISSAGMITPNPTAPSIAGTAHILQDYDSGQ